jgi:hypothetical protein
MIVELRAETTQHVKIVQEFRTELQRLMHAEYVVVMGQAVFLAAWCQVKN